MSSAVLKLRKAEDALSAPSPRRLGQLIQLMPPSKQPAVMDWARVVATAADRRVAQLEARLAYLESQIGIDELTSLLNRRGFMNAFVRANDAAKRGGPGGVVIVCDLDGFKNVNDLLGHAQGDEVLRQLGTLIRRKTRKMDAAARLGGDEFALLLVGASVATAKRKCQYLNRMIGTIGLGASFGIAAFDGSEDEDRVLHQADMAMYEEKRASTAASKRSRVANTL